MFRPTQFGKYYLTKRIAVGGMAEIFKAKLYGVSGFEKPMVVKQILPQYSKNAEFIKMFIDEAKIAVTLTHGNIVPVYELGRLGDTYFIAMEYVSGQDLAQILEAARDKRIPISPEHAVFIAIEICKGLDYAHRRTNTQGRPLGVVHRDISPPNVLVSLEGEIKITDFGVAKATHKMCSTESGVVKGTYGYMSPEQLLGLPVDHRTDIFSTGILLHEMLTGRRLFAGRNELETIQRIKEAKVAAPSTLREWIPSSVDPIVFKALARDPADRYSSANEFQLALSRFLFTAGQGATSSTLSTYLNKLFGSEKPVETEPREEILYSSFEEQEPPTTPDAKPQKGGVDNLTQSYAVRPEFEEATGISNHPAPEMMESHAVYLSASSARMVKGGKTNKPVDATLALPSLAASDTAEHEFEDDGPTNRISGNGRPRKPDVPELRFPPMKGRVPHDESKPKTLPSIPSAKQEAEGGLPTTDELAALADSISEDRPARLPEPSDPDARPVALKQVAGTGEVEIHSVGPDTLLDESQPVPVEESGQAKADPLTVEASQLQKQKGKVASMLSGTMKLFVDGLDNEEEYPLQDSVPAQEVLEPEQEPGLSGMSQALEVPRTIKPTVLGWILIGVVVIAAAVFVIYKKTSIFGTESASEDEGKLTASDLKKATPKKQSREGTITLTSNPSGATFFLFLGETPMTVKRLDLGRDHLIRLEREGYQGVYKTIKPDAFKEGKAEITQTLDPVGPGAINDLPQVDLAGSDTGKHGTLTVKSTPPKAMVWRLVGRGEQVQLKGIDKSRSFYFKAMLQGFQPSFVRVSEVDFEDGDETFSTTVVLERDPKAGDGSAAPAASQADAAPADAAEPKAEPAPKAEPKRKARTRTRPRRVRTRSRRARTRARKRIRKPSKKKRKKKSSSHKKLQTPSWAR